MLDTDFIISVGATKTWEELEARTGYSTTQSVKRIEQLRIDASHLPSIPESHLRSLPRNMVLKYTNLGSNVSRIDVYEGRTLSS